MNPLPDSTPSASEARAALEEIDRIIDRTRKTIACGNAAPTMMVWGAIWLVGFCASQWDFGLRHRVIWAVLALIGFGLSLYLRWSRRDSPVKSPRSSRIALSWLLLFVFAALWTFLFSAAQPARANGTFSEQQSHALVAFWCTVPMLAYAVMGLWLDRFYLWLGLTVTAVTIVGYFCVPDYLYLVLGLFGGGSFIAAGAYAIKYWR